MNNHTKDSFLHQMFFEVSHQSTVVFEEFQTKNLTEIIIACVALLVISFSYEGLKVLREVLYHARAGSATDTKFHLFKTKILSANHIIQSILHMLQVAIGYILMLAFMTFNVGICLAILIGAGLGYFVFKGLRKQSNNVLTENCS